MITRDKKSELVLSPTHVEIERFCGFIEMVLRLQLPDVAINVNNNEPQVTSTEFMEEEDEEEVYLTMASQIEKVSCCFVVAN